MNITRNRFCLNRKVAPQYSLKAFFHFTQACGFNKVELRNDMASLCTTDSLNTQQVKQLAQQHHLEIETINALGQFNFEHNLTKTIKATHQILAEARAIGAKSVILCPSCNATDSRSAAQKEQETKTCLNELAPLFKHYQINGLIEPLGFTFSSLRTVLATQNLIAQNNLPFKIVLDTFHHYLSVEDEQIFEKNLAIDLVGFVHLSGVEDHREKNLLSDEQRLLITKNDRLKSVQQVQRLETMGYQGVYSFEPFSSTLERWQLPTIQQTIQQSITLLHQTEKYPALHDSF